MEDKCKYFIVDEREAFLGSQVDRLYAVGREAEVAEYVSSGSF